VEPVAPPRSDGAAGSDLRSLQHRCKRIFAGCVLIEILIEERRPGAVFGGEMYPVPQARGIRPHRRGLGASAAARPGTAGTRMASVKTSPPSCGAPEIA
jgi:hypothetical protein